MVFLNGFDVFDGHLIVRGGKKVEIKPLCLLVDSTRKGCIAYVNYEFELKYVENFFKLETEGDCIPNPVPIGLIFVDALLLLYMASKLTQISGNSGLRVDLPVQKPLLANLDHQFVLSDESIGFEVIAVGVDLHEAHGRDTLINDSEVVIQALVHSLEGCSHQMFD